MLCDREGVFLWRSIASLIGYDASGIQQLAMLLQHFPTADPSGHAQLEIYEDEPVREENPEG